MQKLDMYYFENNSTGRLSSILNDDINQLERFLDVGPNQMIHIATSVLVIGGVFFYVSPLVACVSFLPMPLILWGTFYFKNRLEPLYVHIREAAGRLSTRLNNNISGIATIQSFVTESYERAHLHEDSDAYRAVNISGIRVSAAFVPVIRMGILLGFLSTLILGAYEVSQSRIAVGSYSVLVFLTQRLLWPLTGLAQAVDLYQRGMASAKRALGSISAST